jgi:hypothetical protein
VETEEVEVAVFVLRIIVRQSKILPDLRRAFALARIWNCSPLAVVIWEIMEVGSIIYYRKSKC